MNSASEALFAVGCPFFTCVRLGGKGQNQLFNETHNTFPVILFSFSFPSNEVASTNE